jgi:thioredoxin reductase (NADPH)
MNDARHVPLVIVGGGPAGLTAAIYAVRAGVPAELIERGVMGGQVFIADRIENYPGFPEPVSGPDLSERIHQQAQRLGAKMTIDTVEKIELDGQRKKLTLQSGATVTCDALILAPGSAPRKLGVEGEGRFWGRGVSYCATCDGNFFRGQRVAIVGGGDSACQEAQMLAHLAQEVYIIHRRHQFRAQEFIVTSALQEPNIKVRWDTVVEEIEGEAEVKSVRLRNLKTDEVSRLEVDGVFIYVGVMPQTDLVKDLVELDAQGYIKAGEDAKTSVPGIFAAGDARTKPFMQIVTAAADGANAVRSCEIYFIERGLSARYI